MAQMKCLSIMAFDYSITDKVLSKFVLNKTMNAWQLEKIEIWSEENKILDEYEKAFPYRERVSMTDKYVKVRDSNFIISRAVTW